MICDEGVVVRFDGTTLIPPRPVSSWCSGLVCISDQVPAEIQDVVVLRCGQEILHPVDWHDRPGASFALHICTSIPRVGLRALCAPQEGSLSSAIAACAPADSLSGLDWLRSAPGRLTSCCGAVCGQWSERDCPLPAGDRDNAAATCTASSSESSAQILRSCASGVSRDMAIIPSGTIPNPALVAVAGSASACCSLAFAGMNRQSMGLADPTVCLERFCWRTYPRTYLEFYVSRKILDFLVKSSTLVQDRDSHGPNLLPPK